MTKYSTLTTPEKDVLERNFNEPSEWRHGITDEQKQATIEAIKADKYCAVCWRSDYTCLCSHEN